jgi:aminobenzoyl-glutamate utilization protein B
MKEVIALLERVIDVARGAALMTGTEVEWKLLHGCHGVLPNRVISDLLHENLLSVPLPVYSKEEIQFSHALSATLSADQKKNTLLGLGLDVESAESLLSSPIHAGIGYWGKGWTIPASTDVGDVSHIAPTAQINTATYPMGIGSHTWQATSSSGSSVGMKGMLYAAKVLGASAFDLMTRSDVLAKAKEEFSDATQGEVYQTARDLIDRLG